MKLSFLGKSYDASNPTMEATETQEMGTFLGRSYAKKSVTVAHRRPSPEVLTYRGQLYTR